MMSVVAMFGGLCGSLNGATTYQSSPYNKIKLMTKKKAPNNHKEAPDNKVT